MKLRPLERVEITAINGEAFPENTRLSGPASSLLQSNYVLVKRNLVVERDVRDNSCNILHVREVEKGERIKAQARNLEPGIHQAGDNYFRELWRRVWPTTNSADRAGDWWKQ